MSRNKSLYSLLNLPVNALLIALLLLATTSQNSFAADRGEEVFRLCTACHGDNAEGKRILKAPSIAGLPAWYIEAQINKFRNGARGAHPKDVPGMRMRPMARTLYNKEDITSVSNFVSKLKPMEPAADAKAEVKGSVIAGEKQFALCASCHGVDGEGMKAVNAPPLTRSNDWYLLTQLKNFKNGLRGNDPVKDPTGATMKGMATILDDQAMHDVIVYIQTLK